jgi:hypothetical protein
VPDSVVATILTEVLGDVPVVRVAITDRSTSFVLRVAGPFKPGVSVVGDLLGTVSVRNSGVGYASLWAALSLYRVACGNGLLLPERKAVVLNRRHLGLREHELKGSMVERLRGLPARFQAGASTLEGATRIAVENVETDVRAALKESHLPLRFMPAVMAAHGTEPLGSTVFSVAQALSRAAQMVTAEERLQLEAAAASYLRRAMSGSR